MKQYHDLLRHLLDNGVKKSDRTGTGTLSVFGHQMRFNLQDGFPLLTTKKLHTKSIIHELLWFLKGDTNIAYLKDNGVSIWNEWADENGNLGPVYGYQWRSWPNPDGTHTDQITKLVEGLKKNPDGRRHIVSAWNPSFIDQMALPPCHCLGHLHNTVILAIIGLDILSPLFNRDDHTTAIATDALGLHLSSKSLPTMPFPP